MRAIGRVAVLCGLATAIACGERRTEVKPAPPPAALVPAKFPTPPADAPTVIVEDLTGEGIPDLAGCTIPVSRGLALSGRAHVVVRSEIVRQMKECTEVDCQQRVSAPLVGARYVVSGSANRLGDAYIIQLKLLQPDGGVVLARVTRQGPGDPSALLFEAGREIGAAVPAK